MFQFTNFRGTLIVNQSAQRWYRVLTVVLVVEAVFGWTGVAQAPSLPQSQEPQPLPVPPRSRLQVTNEKLVNGCASKLDGDQRSREGGPVGYTAGLVYEIVVQNPGDAEIVLSGLRADVTRRQPRSSSGALTPPPRSCRFWTDQPIRSLVFNLDVDRPSAVSAERVETGGSVSMNLPSTGAPSKSFPYKVLRGESEVFHVGFETSQCDCEFTLVVEAAAGGESIETALPTIHRVVPKDQ